MTALLPVPDTAFILLNPGDPGKESGQGITSNSQLRVLVTIGQRTAMSGGLGLPTTLEAETSDAEILVTEMPSTSRIAVESIG